jgi:tRNA G18 (ribose-2'-O)-methylase SpoU
VGDAGAAAAKSERFVTRGFFEIGIYRGKTPANVGTLWRSAFQMGAAGIFTVGRRYPKQASDTVKAYRHIPCREYLDFDALVAGLPYSCPLVAVEMGGKPLQDFAHPESAVYLLGAEDHGIPPALLARCHHVISLPAIRTQSYNVAVAGSLVMFDRLSKINAWRNAA